MNLAIKEALAEVLAKDDVDIERETALNWAARSVACVRVYKTSGTIQWLIRAEAYYQEALEHAALVRDGGGFVGELQRTMERETR